MKLLVYRGLDTAGIPGYEKLATALRAGDFRSSEVKKVAENLYRARLDPSNRLLFALYWHGTERCILVLEYVHQHACDQLINPRLAWRVEGEWIPIYHLLVPDRLALALRNLEWVRGDWDPNAWWQEAIDRLRALIERLDRGEALEPRDVL